MRAILTYHSLDESGSPISVPPRVFAQHMSWLSTVGVRVLSLDGLLALDPLDSADAVSITFDDGFKNISEAASALAERGLPLTLFIVTGHVGGSNAWGGKTAPGIPTLPLLDWSDLERLVGRGATIGAHTRTHARLTTLASSAVVDEMQSCADELRARLGVVVSHFAYPYGAVDSRVASIARSRFSAAVTTRFSPLDAGSPLAWLPRLDMYYFRRPGTFESWGTPRFRRRLRWVGLKRGLREALT